MYFSVLPVIYHSFIIIIEAVKTLAQVFISCYLDYCNSRFYGITEGLMSRLQSVQNAENTWCRALDGTTTSRQCYRSCTGFQFDVGWISRWLPSSTCHCPSWLQTDCQMVSDEGRRQLRSTTSRTCVVRWTFSNYEDRCFFRNWTAFQLICDCDKLTLTFSDMNG